MVLWLVCIVAFVVGQFLAPPDYHLMSGNPWGNLFGTSVVLGIISFCLMVMFFVIDKTKKGDTKKPQQTKPKYNFSLKRILSRLLLTGVVGIIFGIAMFPFMTVVNGMLYEQRAAIGGQNILRMIVLWGIFTLIVSLFTFWKKRFRMVSVFLIICGIFALIFYLTLGMYDANNYRCNRATPYSMPNEFNRSLDLISQRVGVDSTGSNTIWQGIFNFRNCLDIQYSETDDKNLEAYFEYPLENSQENLQDLKILVNPSYKNFDDLTLAALLSHEVIHAGQYINQVVSKTQLSCYEKEAKAFSAQHAFILSLNAEEQRSIYTRLRDDVNKNPTFAILILTGQRGNEAASACSELQTKNNLTNEQMNECSWQGLENKLLQDIKEDPYYQEQCGY